MKDIESFLKSIADGLRSFASVVDTIAEKTEVYREAQKEPEEEKETAPEPKKRAEPEVKPPRKPRRKRVTKPGRSATAAEAVYDVIKANKNGIDTADLMVQTGYDEKKVRNIIYKLKKQGRIKTAKRGVYVAT